ncbi:vgrg protein [Clostridium sp. ZS2-4]|uniref:VgrG-related protein n=1 Tax=Clostridium sp. ZS2-4 TaxID=2987703 RepID=UPI00227AD2A6|nr:vgrg protein [Clostridium sp. ZS2-4]MCY6354250.1 vgrg protein [Clostridium sp. ZS2-4]
MTISANDVNNIFLKNYMSQMKDNINNNATIENNDKNLNKAVEKFAFEVMLNEMMENTGNPMMKDFVSAALNDVDGNSLENLSDFNSAMRSASYQQASLVGYSNGTHDTFSGLGLKASKYESNLNPGAISNTSGDYGEKSYGAWQFSSKTGSLDSFVKWLKSKDGEFYSKLSEAKSRDENKFGKNFDAEWITIALTNKDKFMKLQQDYVKQSYYDTAAQTLKSKFGFDINQRSDALKESLWSTVVQHGVRGTEDIFSKLNLSKDDSGIINDLYNERQKVNIYFRSSSEQVKRSVYNRFTREKQDMLNML